LSGCIRSDPRDPLASFFMFRCDKGFVRENSLRPWHFASLREKSCSENKKLMDSSTKKSEQVGGQTCMVLDEILLAFELFCGRLVIL
jgi:hypothetical protein